MEELLNEAKLLLFRGDYSAAYSLYQKILQDDEENIEALHAIALICFQQKEYTAAIEHLNRAISTEPSNPELFSSLAIVYQKMGNVSKSADVLRSVKEIFEAQENVLQNPKYFKTLTSLAEMYLKEQRYNEAKFLLQTTLRLEPSQIDALKLLAQVYVALGRYYHAIKTLEKLNVPAPLLEAMKTEVFLLKKDYRNALKSIELAIKLEPSAKFYNLLGECYVRTMQLGKAIDAYKAGLDLDPCHYEMLGRLLALQIHTCEWNERPEVIARFKSLIASVGDEDCLLGIRPTIAILAGFSNKELLKIAKAHSKKIEAQSIPLREGLNFSHSKHKGKIRLGYLSSDFHNHATLHLMSDVFGFHDREKFEVYAYSYGVKDRGYYRKKLVADCDQFVDISGLSDRNSAIKINQDEIDILIDLKGHISDHRLGIASLRPAPLQMHYLGYPGTIGASFIDYLIADHQVIPDKERKYYSESIIYLPVTYQANCREKIIHKRSLQKRAYQLPENHFVFCCFNQNDKFDPETVSLWMAILSQVKESVLWLWGNYPGLKHKIDAYAKERGIDPSRFIVSPSEPSPKHLARLPLADLFLDTLNYSAHTSCSDAIRVGLPVLTCEGSTFASRVAASLLRLVNAETLIAHSHEEYVSKAVDFAKSPKKLNKIREEILQLNEKSDLYDSSSFTRSLDLAYLKAWERHQNGLPPEDITLE